MLFRRIVTYLSAVALMIVPVTAAHAKPKYAKSEMDKAVGACVGSVLGGALLGALFGRAVGGKNATAGGAIAGAGVGGAICAVLIANARHRDDIIRAQMAAVREPGRPVSAVWTDEAGQPVTYTTRASTATYDGSQLMPVKYQVAGTKILSPNCRWAPPIAARRAIRPATAATRPIRSGAAAATAIIINTA